ncbi:MAG: indolepyruvate oxidoreductase subunit beta [Bacteroidales bacterium]|nr:indolepyruvate oxidoreductase subunit beta [Bacteroidales bacterium]
MKQDIILAGVGGQGILSIATVIGRAALDQDLYLKQAEVHGMSQRGGDVQSNLRLSSEPICSDLIPKGCCDLIVSLEPMEALRYLPYLAADGWIITNTTPFVNIPNYPEETALRDELHRLPHVIAIDVDALAKEVRSPRSANMVLLGATASVLRILDPDKLRDGIRKVFARKGDAVVETNIAAFDAGFAYAKEHLAR